MANPHKGEVALQAGEVTYTLRFSIDAICQMEEASDRGFPLIAADLADPRKVRLSLVRDVLFAGLREKHPEVTLKEAGELMVTAGGMNAVLAKVCDALAVAFPSTEASGTPRPPKGRKRGTGPTS